MKALWTSTNFDLRSVLSAPPSPKANKSTSNSELDFPSVSNQKVNPSECGPVLSESSSHLAFSESVFDFRSISNDGGCQLGCKQVNNSPQYDNIKIENDLRYYPDLRSVISESSKHTSENVLDVDSLSINYKENVLGPKYADLHPPCNPTNNDYYYDPSFYLRSVISESSSSKPTSESVLEFDSGVVNYKENVLGPENAYYPPPCSPTKNDLHYDPAFDLRSIISESSSSKHASESDLEFYSGVVNYKENVLGSKHANYRPPCNPANNGSYYDPDFDLRSVIRESSKPPSESVLDFDSGMVNHKENVLGPNQVYYSPPCNPTKNDYLYDPYFDLRSTLRESLSPKLSSESKLHFESEVNNKEIPSESKQADNRPRCNPTFDLRYILDARQSDVKSEECVLRQKIIMQSKNTLIEIHRDTSEINHSDFLVQRNKKTMKRRKERSRNLRRKKCLEKVIISDIFDPVKQELADLDETPSSVTEFLRRMRYESDKRKDLKSAIKII